MKIRFHLRIPCAAVVFLALMGAALAEVPSALEPEYAEAVLTFNSGNHVRSLEILRELRRKSPETPEFLELQALNFKATRQPEKATEVYRELIRLRTQAGAPKEEIAPYSFEMGVLRFQEKQYRQAEQYLDYSLRNGFNPEASHLYLGLSGVQTQDFRKAENHFKAVTDGQIDELKAAAHFYLGQIFFQQQLPSRGFDELITARQIAQAHQARTDVTPESLKMALEIEKGVRATLTPLDRRQTFANVSFAGGYDSNVLLVPNEADAAASGSAESTLKLVLGGQAGFATSPIRTWQAVPSFRFSANKNLNSDTRSGEFTETGLALFLNRDPLAYRSSGVRLDTAVTFQNEFDRTTDESRYRLYTQTLGVAPYLRRELSRGWVASYELKTEYVRFNGDAELVESLRRNGPTVGVQAMFQRMRPGNLLNPTLSLEIEREQTRGDEFRATLFGLSAINASKVGQYQFLQSLRISRTAYLSSASDRADTLVGALLSAQRKLSERWSMLGSMDYTRNQSNLDTAYSYNRFNLTTGLTCIF